MLFGDIVASVGNTPLIELKHLSHNPAVRIFAKLEGFNPTGSVKDRPVSYMLADALESGALESGMILLESTSGNTGIALAMMGRQMGYSVKVVIPENAGRERIQLLELYGAETVFSDRCKGFNGAVEKAMEIGSDGIHLILDQYANEANPRSHFETTGPEILADLPRVDAFIAGLGTGGTLMGVGRYLKQRLSDVRIVAVEPVREEMVDGLRNLDDGFIPPIIDMKLLDGKYIVSSIDAVRSTRSLCERENLFVGVSSGAVAHAAGQLSAKMGSGNIVALFADNGWKYLSSNLWSMDEESLESELGDMFLW